MISREKAALSHDSDKKATPHTQKPPPLFCFKSVAFFLSTRLGRWFFPPVVVLGFEKGKDIMRLFARMGGVFLFFFTPGSNCRFMPPPPTLRSIFVRFSVVLYGNGLLGQQEDEAGWMGSIR